MANVRLIAIALLLLTGAASAQDEETRDKANWLQFGASWRRDEAVEWLYKQGPEAFGEVVRGLKSEHADARLIAVNILLHYATQMESVERHGNVLARGLKDSDAEVCRKIGKLLEKAGPKNTNALVRALAYKSPDARRVAATTLARFGDPVRPRLLKLLAARSPRLRAGAALALAWMTPPRTDVVPKMLPLLSDKSEDVRAAAATVLGRAGAGEPNVVRKLIGLLADDSPKVFVAARDGIMRSSSACSLLADELSRNGGVPEERLLSAMARLQGDAPTFEKLLLGADVDRRVRLLDARPPWVLQNLASETGAQVARWLDSKHAATRRAAARFLADPSFAHPALALKTLDPHRADPDPSIRAAAVRCLAFHGPRDPQTVAALREARVDPAPAVRTEAILGLWQAREPAPGTVEHLRELVARHKSPSAAQALSAMAPWSLVALNDLVAASQSDDADLACEALRTLAILSGYRSRHGLEFRSTRLAEADPKVRAACDRALRWLAGHQDTRKSGVGRADGRWDSDGFVAHDAQPRRGRGHPECDVGVTGLALLAFLGAGHEDTMSAYAKHVQEGLQYLVREQRQETGVFGSQKPHSFLIQHGIATVALCEATLLGCGDYRNAAQQGLSYICMARDPKSAWGYVPRGGSSDLYHTTWMVTALRLGVLAGFEVDPEAFRGAWTCIDKLTHPLFGQIGYDRPGGTCARSVRRGALETKGHPPLPQELTTPILRGVLETRAEQRAREEREREREQKLAAWWAAHPDHGRSNSQASTAQGVWARMVADPHRFWIGERAVWWKGRNLCIGVLPVWDPEGQTIDLSYWHWGALALTHATPAKAVAPWIQQLQEELLANQQPDGSWDPVGAWGPVGGRLYSTSAATLALLAPYRFPRGFLRRSSENSPPRERVRKALEEATRHSAWRCRVVATELAESVR